MTRPIGLIGVPSSAGAHWPGQDKAPRALRDAGLVEQLKASSVPVIDHGDLPRMRSRLDKEQRHPHNLAAVMQVATAVADQVEAAVRADETPLVIGGDCTIELGVLAGFLREGTEPALLYFDGGVDLLTPATNPTGILDSMGIAHMVGEPGAAEVLCRIGPRVPLMPDEDIVLFGYGPHPGPTGERERQALARRTMPRYPLEQVQGRAAEAATEARHEIEQRAGWFVVHFDVDVIDFVDFPVADVPQFNCGLTLQEALTCLGIFARSPRFGGLVITEFNPDHADEDGALAADFVKGIAHALAPAF